MSPAAAGTAPVIPVQIADRDGSSTDETMMRGIRHAVINGAKVINISAGGPGYSQAFQDTILWAAARGALVVASVGNQGQDVNALNYPAGYRRVLGVGAQCDGVVTFDCPRPFATATFSNHNRTVDVIAPGVNVLSSVPKRVSERVVAPGYALKDGTSMASPYVAGVAALVMAANGGTLSPYQVLRQIKNTATDIGPTGRDNTSGFGVVNPRAAVTLQGPPDDPGEVNDDVKWLRGATPLDEVGTPLVIEATADQFEDSEDVYAVRLARGERLRTVLTHGKPRLDLYLWDPGTRTVGTENGNLERHLIDYRPGTSSTGVIVYRARRGRRLLRRCVRPPRRRRLHAPADPAALMATGPHTVLFYDYVPDILERRAPHREAHLARIGEWVASGAMLSAGALGDPPTGAMFVFGDVPEGEVAALRRRRPLRGRRPGHRAADHPVDGRGVPGLMSSGFSRRPARWPSDRLPG